jgi:hypothetical protein
MMGPMRSPTWLLLPLSFVAVTLMAAHLTPAASGFGTHQALGLPPCLFHHFTGLPCPSCGLTTSLTQLLHFHGHAALHAHPLGPAIYLLWGLLSFAACLEFFGLQTPLGKFLQGQYSAWAYGAMVLYFLTWGTRLMGRFF